MDPWFYSSYSFVSHLSPICLPHSGCSNARLGPFVLLVILICLPFVSHILDALTHVWDPWFYASYSFVSHLSPICLPHSGCSNARLGPLVLHVILICSRLFPICLPHSGCSNARLGPLVLHVILICSRLFPICLPHSGCSDARLGPLVLLICLPLVSHLSPDALTPVDPWIPILSPMSSYLYPCVK